MEEYYPLLAATPLFADIPPEGLARLLGCFAPAVRRYEKGDILLLAGYDTGEIGILLEGSATALKTTPDGAAVAITDLAPGSVFGDVLAGSAVKSPVTITARSASKAMFISCRKLLCPCAAMHPEHTQLMQNLVRTISDKYFLLSRRVDLLVMKTLRAKVCAYLLSEAEVHHSLTFTIPYSRIQLADYLNCDRSALSRELSLMQKDGLLDTFKSSFKLLDPDALKQMVQ